jgi:muskelin
MKHLRQRRLLTPVEFIQSKCNIRLEHPLVASLHKSLVLKGDFSSAEEILLSCLEQGLFDSYIHASQPRAVWTRIHASDADGDEPKKRGGHAMCIDSDGGLIYLHGGWDGKNSLDDFWVYDIAKERWRLLSQHTGDDKNGPGPRACHKMVFDRKVGSIYILGKLADEEGHRIGPDGTTAEPNASTATDLQFCSEFYRYRTRGLDAGSWDLLNFDTAVRSWCAESSS